MKNWLLGLFVGLVAVLPSPVAHGQRLGPRRATLLRGQVRQSRLAAYAATGFAVPTTVVDNGEVNATSYRRGIVVNSVPPLAARGVLYHEMTHEFYGDPLNNRLPVRLQEGRADFGAGYLMAQTQTAPWQLRAYLRLMASDVGDPSHGRPAARVWTTLAGYRAAMRSW